MVIIEILFFIALFLFIIVTLFISSAKNENEKMKSMSLNYIEYGIKYLGGFKDIEGGNDKKCNLAFANDKLYVEFGNNRKVIEYDNIKDISIQSNQQIQQSVSLGKMICFGVFALGMKENKTIVKNYFVITFVDENKERSIILDYENKLENLYSLFKRYTTCKI